MITELQVLRTSLLLWRECPWNSLLTRLFADAHGCLPMHNRLLQVLHRLGGWPAGLWQRVDEGAEPYGEMLQVGRRAASQQSQRCSSLLNVGRGRDTMSCSS